jgi:hypothetical protein
MEFHVNFLPPRIWRWLLDLWQVCAHLWYTVFWDKKPYSLADIHHVLANLLHAISRQKTKRIFCWDFRFSMSRNSDTVTQYPEDGSVRKFLPDYTMSQPKRRSNVIITAMLANLKTLQCHVQILTFIWKANTHDLTVRLLVYLSLVTLKKMTPSVCSNRRWVSPSVLRSATTKFLFFFEIQRPKVNCRKQNCSFSS